ncbi:MAG: flagellar motor switch protein FliG, partial [Betaproteobacteria bacterium]|nr:flagellar motor switch protein FliG [Betaproteobacteria bacterium]
GTTPSWAVLSARRLNFQGRDAVLTAFTPINKLKVMEQRLELWAKVFEASSESIIIMDEARKIISVNQAFCRSTGYDFYEALGQDLSFVMNTPQDTVWADLEDQNDWQGEVHFCKQNGDTYPAWLMVSSVHKSATSGEVVNYIGISIDITDRKAKEERIRFLAQHDVLTELPNRALCQQRLGEAIAKTTQLTREKVDEVVDKFTGVAASQSLLVSNSGDYVRSVLKLALGDDKAALLIDRILQGGDVSGIESLKWMDPLSVAELLRNEHPQIVAAILVHLDYDQAADVLKNLTERQRNEVMLRVATMEGIQPTALKDLNEVLFKVLAGGDKIRKSSLGGVKTAAEMINLMGTAIEGTVIESIRSHDADLAQKIMDKMFVFDDLNKLDDKAIQMVLKEVSSDVLIVALKGAQPELKDKILANMS